MATTPNFAVTPKAGVTTLATANTAFDGTGTLGTILTGAANGTRIDMIVVSATATVSAGLINLFVSDTTAANTSANTHILRSLPVTATTPSATTAPFQTTLTSQTNPELLPLFLPSGYTLRAGTTVAQGFRVMANGGDF